MSHGGGGDDGDPNRWLVSYADFITLLMVLFVIMWSMGQTDIEKFRQLAESLKAAFSSGTGTGAGGGGGGGTSAIDSMLGSSGGSDPYGVPDPISIPGIPKKPPASVEVAGMLSDTLQEYNVDGGVSIQTSVEGVLISLSEKILFTPGTAELQSDAYPIIDSIIEMLQSIDNEVKIVGHTDDTQPIDPQYTNNWELSMARAWLIADYLIDAGVAEERIIVEGRGQYQPIFPNDTPEHRALNSRADIVILYTVDSNVISGDSPLSIP